MWAEGREAELAVRFIRFRHLPVSGTAPVHVRLGAIRPATPTPALVSSSLLNPVGAASPLRVATNGQPVVGHAAESSAAPR